MTAVSLRATLLAAIVIGPAASDQICEEGTNLFQRHHHHHRHHHKKHHMSASQASHLHQRPVQSVLQSKGLNTDLGWQYQDSEFNDWEKDLIADDDDKLADTMKKYTKDPTIFGVEGNAVVPTPQNNADFNEDYPKDAVGPLEPTFQGDVPQNDKNETTATNVLPDVANQTQHVKPTASPEQGGKAQQASNAEQAKTQVRAARKAVEALKKELEDAKAKAKDAHAFVLTAQTAVKDERKSIAAAKGQLDKAVMNLSWCQEYEEKLEVDSLIAKQAKAALQARLEMLKKQRAATALQVRSGNITVAVKEKEAKDAKKKLDVATKEQLKKEKKQEAAEAALQNATDALTKTNQTLTEAIAAVNSTLDQREEAKTQAKQKSHHALPFPS